MKRKKLFRQPNILLKILLIRQNRINDDISRSKQKTMDKVNINEVK